MGNDTAADFALELDGQRRWTVVKAALKEATKAGASIDSDVSQIAIAAAEAVAHGIGRPTQTDAYTQSIEQFVGRARRPGRRLAEQATRAVEVAASTDGELAQLWGESGSSEWREAITRLVTNLSAD